MLATDMITFDPASGIVTIEGTPDRDEVDVALTASNDVEVILRGTASTEAARFDVDAVRRIHFFALAGDDEFINRTSIPSYAEGGSGNDRLIGGSGSDEFHGGDGDDELEGRDGDDLLVGGDGEDRLYGDDGDDHLFGGAHEDRLYGGAGRDVLEGGGATDRMYGGEGDDEMHGGDGEDRMYGDGGNDVMYGDEETDYLFGDEGNDTLWGGAAYDRLYGGVGDDMLSGDDGDDRIYAEAGNDQLFGGAGEDKLYGDDGVDILHGGDDIDALFGGDGDDEIYGDGGEDRIYGEAGADMIFGGADGDKIFAGDGDDVVDGEDGDDRIYGEAGNDRLLGGAGEDTVYGNEGDDYIDTGEDDDKVFAGPGNDTVYTRGGKDSVYGEAGNDYIDTGDQRDTVYGNDGNDVIILGPDDDKAYGGKGDDIIRGGDGEDDLRGEEGNDVLIGGNDSDSLRGFAGRDLLIGGGGMDEVTGDEDDDIMIGGTTSYDDSNDDLRILISVWASSDDYETRVAALAAADAPYHLRSGFTVHDDLAIDELDGEQNRDWYFLTGLIPGAGVYPFPAGQPVTMPPDALTIAPDVDAFDVIRNLDHVNLRDGEQLHTLIPHARNATARVTHAAMLALVDTREVTHEAVLSGAWSDPNTWLDGQIPENGARVRIPFNITVTIDQPIAENIRTVRVDGLLNFATTVDTELRVDTLIVTPSGRLEVGTAAAPIAGDVTARIVITDTGPIDRDWDPLALSRGLILHGSFEMQGEQRTSHVSLMEAPREGATLLALAEVPVNWRVGDELVIAGTEFGEDSHETRVIRAIDLGARTVTVDPLEFDHRSPRAELLVDVAHLTRNAVIESEAIDSTHRGHTMFMHNQRARVSYAGFYRLGRTDKLQDIDDPRLDDAMELIDGTGTNARGRYSIHFHRGGVVNNGNPGIIRGVVVTDSPGWGIVVHSSYVDVEDSVVLSAGGGSFVTEAGDEIGAFRNNIAIHTIGSGEGITDRSDLQDFGHQGVGFWLQGSGVVVEGNIASGHAAHGFMFYSRPLEETDLGSEPQFLAANLFVPEIANGRDSVPVTDLPILEFRDNVAYASIEGVNIRYHLEKAKHDVRGSIEGLTLWNNRTGMNVYYARNLDVDDLTIVSSVLSFDGTGLDHNDASEGLRYSNVFIEGYFTGVDLPRGGNNVLDGGYLRNSNNIAIVSAERERSILIRDVVFDDLAGFDGHLNIWMIFRSDGDDLRGLTPDRIMLDYGRFNNARLFFYQQAADFVPFPRFDSDIPDEYVGKTNAELFDEFGVAVGGAVATGFPATGEDLINGLVDNR